MKYKTEIVLAYFKECGLPQPHTELKFHVERKWRFDFAWWDNQHDPRRWVALEIEGGVWSGGRHTRGSGFAKDMEKYNEAAALGWRIIRVQPKDLCTLDTVKLIKRCLML